MNDAELNAQMVAFVADLFRQEAQHWENEYRALEIESMGKPQKPRKIMAAWKLGAGILRRRAEQYESGTVTYLTSVTAIPVDGVDQ